MKLLAFLFWFFVIVYLLGMVARWLLRAFLMRNLTGRPPRVNRPGKEGEVTVERLDTREKVVDRKVGEYVEYEEVKE